MAIRYYILPMIQVGPFRIPKYFAHARSGTTGVTAASLSMIDYELMPVGIVAADVTNPQHNSIAANPDVRAVPANIDNTVGAGNVVDVRAFLEGLSIPGNWVTGGDTWRQVLRGTAGFFMFAQRVYGRFGVMLLDNGLTLNTQWSELPQGAKTILIETAAELELDTSAATGSTTLRQIFRVFGNAMGERPTSIGGTIL